MYTQVKGLIFNNKQYKCEKIYFFYFVKVHFDNDHLLPVQEW